MVENKQMSMMDKLSRIFAGELGQKIIKGLKKGFSSDKEITKALKNSPNATAKQLAKQDAELPVKVDRKITDDLLMGENVPPAFGSSTYDWVMRKGPGKYSADEWIDHLTSTR